MIFSSAQEFFYGSFFGGTCSECEILNGKQHNKDDSAYKQLQIFIRQERGYDKAYASCRDIRNKQPFITLFEKVAYT